MPLQSSVAQLFIKNWIHRLDVDLGSTIHSGLMVRLVAGAAGATDAGTAGAFSSCRGGAASECALTIVGSAAAGDSQDRCPDAIGVLAVAVHAMLFGIIRH